MAGVRALFFALVIAFMSLDHACVHADFSKDMNVTWGANHIKMAGENLDLVLDQSAGSAVQSKAAYLFGSIEMLIKLIPGNSAGTVMAYYQSSTEDAHDEIDFEFLGNVSGQPYTIHTNLYAQGIGGREMQFRPWFDPTNDFHNYTIHWNPSEIVWFVDETPIRVFRNYENEGIPYPNKQGMNVFITLWDADDWATQGGRIKTDWSLAPFTAQCRRFRANACEWTGPDSISQCATPTQSNWWTSPVYSQLSSDQMSQLQSIQNNFMIYNYCKDTNRFNGAMPPECSKPQF